MVDNIGNIVMQRLSGEAKPREFEREKALVRLFLSTEKKQGIVLGSAERVALPTGVAVALPEGFEGQITISEELSQLASIMLPNSPGTIDPDYRGEIFVIAQNTSGNPISLLEGSHIADMRIRRFVRATFVEVDKLESTDRGKGGMGSTGVV